MGRRLTAFDIAADGGLSNRRVWSEGLGPGGTCMDAEGAVWVPTADTRTRTGRDNAPEGTVVRIREGGEVLDRVLPKDGSSHGDLRRAGVAHRCWLRLRHRVARFPVGNHAPKQRSTRLAAERELTTAAGMFVCGSAAIRRSRKAGSPRRTMDLSLIVSTAVPGQQDVAPGPLPGLLWLLAPPLGGSPPDVAESILSRDSALHGGQFCGIPNGVPT
jgi:hypothetical protein